MHSTGICYSSLSPPTTLLSSSPMLFFLLFLYISPIGFLYPCHPYLRKLALTKLLPSLCKKSKWTIVAVVFYFPKGQRGRWGRVFAVHFRGRSIGNTLEGERDCSVATCLKPACRIRLLGIENTVCVLTLCKAQQTVPVQVQWRKRRTWPCSSSFTVLLWTFEKSNRANVSIQEKLIS